MNETGVVLSSKRLRANRSNSLRSTGPRSVEGKSRACLNAVRHGICAQHSAVGDECASTYALFRTEMKDQLRPITPTQMTWFEEICHLTWQLLRIRDIERAVYERTREPGEPICAVMARAFVADPFNVFERVSLYAHRMRTQLMKLMRAFDYEKRRVDEEREGRWGDRQRDARERAAAEAGKEEIAVDEEAGEEEVRPENAEPEKTASDDSEGVCGEIAERSHREVPAGDGDTPVGAGTPVLEGVRGGEGAGRMGGDAGDIGESKESERSICDFRRGVDGVAGAESNGNALTAGGVGCLMR